MPAASSSTGTMTEMRIAWNSSALLLRVVQTPIVLEESERSLALGHRFLAVGRVSEQLCVLCKVLLAHAKVLLEPVEDLRHLEPARLVAVARPVGQEPGGLLIELALELVGGVRLFAQHGAADRGAIHRV